MARGGWKGLALVVGLSAVLVGAGVLLLVTLASNDPGPVVPSEKSATAAGGPAASGATPTGPRRLAVAGNEGYVVVVNPDGSSYLESPDGTRTELAGPGRPDEEMERTIAKKFDERTPKRTGIGQLVVTDTGVVDVPRDAVITFVGRDKVVTHDQDGSSKVYFVDGRVLSHARGDKGGRTQ